MSVASNGGTECEPGLMFDSKNKVMNHVESFFTTRDSAGIDQQVYA